MKISIVQNETIGSIQKKFQYAYPYLKLEFFKNKSEGQAAREQVPETLTVQYADDQHAHELIDIQSDRTIEELETDLFRKLGFNVQVMRKSGSLWIETTKTDDWTLDKQNQEGEMSQMPIPPYEIPDKDLQDVS